MKLDFLLANKLNKQCTLLMADFTFQGGSKLQIHENTISNTLKSRKFNLGTNNKSVFLVDWHGIRLDVCCHIFLSNQS